MRSRVGAQRASNAITALSAAMPSPTGIASAGSRSLDTGSTKATSAQITADASEIVRKPFRPSAPASSW